MLALDLRAIDADFYATSPHKWLLAPKGTGLLVTRPDRIATTWPLVASGDWQSDDLRRFEHVGTVNESLIAGLAAAVDFQQAIGREAIEARTRHLATGLDAELRAIPGVHVTSPSRPAFRSAIVSFTVDGVSAEELQRILGRERIRTRRVSEFGLEYLRLSTHFFVLPAQIEKTVGLIRKAVDERG
jgi:selenocysteine lyase/cysteine desulfurase